MSKLLIKQIDQAFDNGSQSLRDLSQSLGIASQCGRCAQCAQSMPKQQSDCARMKAAVRENLVPALPLTIAGLVIDLLLCVLGIN